MKKGSITVFLSLVLVLLFSFVLTALEAARIRGASAYVSMLTDLAGDSLLASYYYPLFQQYRLFGIDAGNDGGFFSEDFLEGEIIENLSCGLEGTCGGLLRFRNTDVTELEYKTMLTDGTEEFLSQIRQQVVLDGLSLGLNTLFSEKQFTEAGAIGEVYREQEDALDATATVTTELIKLMELVDGIRMKDGGIFFDKNGKMEAKGEFIKQIIPMEKKELKSCYDNEEIYHTVSDRFFRADIQAEQVKELILEVQGLEDEISRSESLVGEYNDRLQELEKVWAEENKRLEFADESEKNGIEELEAELAAARQVLREEENILWNYESRQNALLSEAKTKYKNIKNTVEAMEDLTKDALKILDTIEKKQDKAKVALEGYEVFLKGIESKLTGELYQVFLQELDRMKIYAGLDERGFSVKTMRKSLETNQDILEDLSFSGFSERKLQQVTTEMASVSKRIAGYTVEGLWFSYGNIVVAEQTWGNVLGFLSDLLTTGILSLVGIDEEEQSDRELTGIELPSAGLEEENILEELLVCIDEVRELFRRGGIGEVLRTAGNAALDATALELYSLRYFHRYGEVSPYTKLQYEREYLIFGAKDDKSNLFSMVLYLVAIRTLFCMVMIFKLPDRMAQLEAISVSVAGFSGIQALGSVAKYSVLLLWSVEEALVEVAALLQGKRIAVMGMGTVSFAELLAMNKANIVGKAGRLPDGIGAAYEDYLALISLTKGTKKKAYRAMDLIQENIRYRYRDSFRIRNLVTGFSFDTGAELNPLFHTGVFSESAYELSGEAQKAY